MGGGGVLTLLPRVIGKSRAAELIFSGDFLSAEQAVEWGLASRVVADDALLDEGLAFARRVADKSPIAVANAKQVMNALWADNGSVDAGLRFELERDVYYCLTSHDAPEGLVSPGPPSRRSTSTGRTAVPCRSARPRSHPGRCR